MPLEGDASLSSQAGVSAWLVDEKSFVPSRQNKKDAVRKATVRKMSSASSHGSQRLKHNGQHNGRSGAASAWPVDVRHIDVREKSEEERNAVGVLLRFSMAPGAIGRIRMCQCRWKLVFRQRVKAALMVQCAWRSRGAKAEMFHAWRYVAAVRIQRTYLRRLARSGFPERHISAAIWIQVSTVCPQLFALNLTQIWIQAHYRGHQARLYFGELHGQVLYEQKRLHHVVRVQAHFRAIIAKKVSLGIRKRYVSVCLSSQPLFACLNHCLPSTTTNVCPQLTHSSGSSCPP